MRPDKAFAAPVSDEKSEAPRRDQANASQSPPAPRSPPSLFCRRPVRGLTCSEHRPRLFITGLSLGSCPNVSVGNDDCRHCRERPLRGLISDFGQGLPNFPRADIAFVPDRPPDWVDAGWRFMGKAAREKRIVLEGTDLDDYMVAVH